MYPIVTIFGKDIGLYAVMAVVGMLAAGFVFCKRIAKSGLDDNDAILFLLSVAGGIAAGGSVLYAITNIKKFPLLLEANTIKEFFGALGVIFGGSVFYGGLIGAIITGSIFIKLKKLPFDIYLDNCALFAPLFHGFARIGCFFGGCCYGIESAFGFCASGNTITDIGDVRRFPVQLLESLLNFGIAALIYLVLKKGYLKGRVFFLYLSLYAVVRFFDEFLRGDAIRGFIFGLSTSQFISIWIEAVALFALLLLPAIKKKRGREYIE